MLKSFAGPFVATFFISMFVLIMQSLWLYIDDLVGKGLEIGVIMQLLYYISLTLVPMGMPLAVLLASIMTFGSLGENYELTAMKSAGVSLYKIMKPLIVVIVLLTVAAFYFSNNVLPYANLKARTLLMDIRRHSPELVFKEGVFINDIEGYSIKVDKINKTTGVMYNMLIYNHTGSGTKRSGNLNYEVTRADSGIMELTHSGDYMWVELYNGFTYTDEGLLMGNTVSFPFRKVKFDQQSFGILMPGNELERSNEDDYKSHYAMLNIKQLAHSADSIHQKMSKAKTMRANNLLDRNYIRSKIIDPKQDSLYMQENQGKVRSLDSLYKSMDIREQRRVLASAAQYAHDVDMFKDMSIRMDEGIIRKHDIEWHKKFSLSFACFIFFFIGAPLGAIIRKGGLGMPVIVSVFLFIIYYIISMMGERAAREVLMPWFGMWLSSVLLLPLGAFLVYTAVNDSAVLNAESYTNMLKSLGNFFQKRKKEDAS